MLESELSINTQSAHACLRCANSLFTVSLSISAAVPLECHVEALDKTLLLDGLGQVADCASPKRSRTDALIREGSDEDERQTAPLNKQVSLQLNAAHAGHVDVRNNTRGVAQVARPQEILGRGECMDGVPERPHEAISRGAHGRVVVNDCYYGRF
jgi:hypothetical protein